MDMAFKRMGKHMFSWHGAQQDATVFLSACWSVVTVLVTTPHSLVWALRGLSFGHLSFGGLALAHYRGRNRAMQGAHYWSGIDG